MSDRSVAAKKGWATRRRKIAWRKSTLGQLVTRQQRERARRFAEQIHASVSVFKWLSENFR